MRLRITTTREAGQRMLIRGQDIRVVDADTGIALEGVQSITWHCGGRKDPPVCIIKLLGVELDLPIDLPPEQAALIRLAREDA